MSVSVSVENLSKRFRVFHQRNRYLKTTVLQRKRARWEEFWALQDVSFEVNEGEAFGIIGHNGSGKSTMLKCLSGILQPDKGSVRVVGKMSSLLELGAGFHPDLSGRENVFLNGAILGLPRKELLRRFDDIVEFAGLTEFIDQPVRNYSTGMTVRLGFAVAINVEPEVLLIDEVLAVGDAEFQAKCRDKISEFRAAGKTIVLVTHGLTDVVSLCDHALWLDHGRAREFGDPAAIVDEYTGVARGARKVEQVEGMRWGSGEARLTKLELIGDDGRREDFATTGEPITFRLHYVTYQPLENVVIGVRLDHQNGQHIAGTNTRLGSRTIPLLTGEGHIDYRIERQPLIEGTYLLSAAIEDWTTTHDYDFWFHGLQFDVLPGDVHDAGYVTLGGVWHLEQIGRVRREQHVDSH